MLMLISPAKKLDFETAANTKEYTEASFLDDSMELIEELRELSEKDISKLMKLSDALSELNYNRFHDFSLPFDLENAKQALYAFRGDVYTGLDADTLTKKELKFAQKHLRILSGLYGILKPLDLMQAYRLEMGTKFKNTRGKDLYEFWGMKLTDELNATLKKQKTDVLLNLASNEYFKSVKKKEINAEIINPVFKDEKNGQYKIISFYAKKARGLMVRYVLDNQITDVEDIKGFDYEDYSYNKAMSKGNDWVFTRSER